MHQRLRRVEGVRSLLDDGNVAIKSARRRPWGRSRWASSSQVTPDGARNPRGGCAGPRGEAKSWRYTVSIVYRRFQQLLHFRGPSCPSLSPPSPPLLIITTPFFNDYRVIVGCARPFGLFDLILFTPVHDVACSLKSVRPNEPVRHVCTGAQGRAGSRIYSWLHHANQQVRGDVWLEPGRECDNAKQRCAS